MHRSSGGQQSPAAPHRSLADMFKERQEADSLDAAIEEAEETARKHADQDSDLEIVDPESERENSILDEPDREETPEELRFDHCSSAASSPFLGAFRVR